MSTQQSVTAQAAIAQESVVKTITFALTGDDISDAMAGIRKVCDTSGLSARQVQYLFECYAKLYKDAADQLDLDAEERRRIGMAQAGHAPTEKLYEPLYTTSGKSVPQMIAVSQSGTQSSPSQCPLSVTAPPGSLAPVKDDGLP